MSAYAGIGSRETPPRVLAAMTTIANKLNQYGYTLYSGGADGADHAFERGSDSNKIIFLPWSGFCGKWADGAEYIVPEYNEILIHKYHPAPHRLKPKGLQLMSRNSYQVLGPDLSSPVKFVLCWTSDGKASGGTGQAMRIAADYNIPIFNMYNKDWADGLTTLIRFDMLIYIHPSRLGKESK